MASASVAEVREQVRRLHQSGSAAEAQAAALRLSEIQKSSKVVEVCGCLLKEASEPGSEAVIFFAAQTLASHSRLGLIEGTDWLGLARQILGVLAASSGIQRRTAAALRQLCVALARLLVWLFQVWPSGVEDVLRALSGGSNPLPLLEALQSLAEEPFSRRLLVDGSLRSQFLLPFRNQVAPILSVIGATSTIIPPSNAAMPLRCAAAWLRAQPGFEEWLPMVGFGGGTHPALSAALPVMPAAIRAARLELGYEAFEAAAELFEAAIPLAEGLETQEASQTVVALLGAFIETCSQLPIGVDGHPAAQRCSADHVSEVSLVIANIVHSAFSSISCMLCDGVWSGLLAAATRLLVFAGPAGGSCVNYDGNGLLCRSLDSWEVLADRHRSAREAGKFVGEASARADSAMESAFSCLLQALPQCLSLPKELQEPPEDLSSLRDRVPKLLIVWCDGNQSRLSRLLALVSSFGLITPSHKDDWMKLELQTFLAMCAAEVLACAGDAADHPLPDPLGSICAALPRLPLKTAPSPWTALIAFAGAELIASLDPWITPDRCPLESSSTLELLRFLFEIINHPYVASPAVEALSIVISNFAAPLVAGGNSAEAGKQVLEQLRLLCLGGSGLAPALRTKLLRSALGPLLSRLPDDQLNVTLEELCAPLRAAATSSGACSADATMALRLLFHLLASPTANQPLTALTWLTSHWSFFEAAIAPEAVAAAVPDATTDAACNALTVILSHARGELLAIEVACRAAPILTAAVVSRGSVASLAALANLVRVFKGGGKEAAVEIFAARILEITERLLGGGPDRIAQLPSDLLSELLELWIVALAPRCSMLSQRLLGSPGFPLAVAIEAVAPCISVCTDPRCVCRSFLLWERLPAWLEKGLNTHSIVAGNILDRVLLIVAASSCQLLAASPLAMDDQVLSAFSRSLLCLVKVRQQAFCAALVHAAENAGVARSEGELLSQQIADPFQNEEALCEGLREAAESWQADHMRRTLVPNGCK